MSESIHIDPFSQTAYFLECFLDDKSLAIGTCFFVQRDNQDYLITNWHNVTGQSPIDKTYLGKYAVSPNNFIIKVFKNQSLIEWTELKIQLQNADGDNLWLEHPIHKEKVDVVAIKVNIPEDKLVFWIEKFIEPFNESTTVRIKDDLYIIGFPFGITGGGGLPIWKRASIASEPDIDIQSLPKMFVDTATRSGMSGSPVIYKEKRAMPIGNGPPEKATSFSSHFMKFVGIYSGRIGAEDELKAQLGIVWKGRVIDEIISQ